MNWLRNIFNWGPLPVTPVFDRGAIDDAQDEEDAKIRNLKSRVVKAFVNIIGGIGFLIGTVILLLAFSFFAYLREHPLQTPAEEIANSTPAELQFQMGRYVEPMPSNDRQCFGDTTEPSVIWFDDQAVNRVEIESDGDYLFLNVYDWDDNAISEYQLQPNQQLAWLRIVVTNCGNGKYNVFEIPQVLQVADVQHLTTCQTELFDNDEWHTRQTDLYGVSALEDWTYYYLHITQVNGSELRINTFMHGQSMEYYTDDGGTQWVSGDFRGDVIGFVLNNGDVVLLHVAWPDGDPSSGVEPINTDSHHLTTLSELQHICP